jgi:hypothetical protein
MGQNNFQRAIAMYALRVAARRYQQLPDHSGGQFDAFTQEDYNAYQTYASEASEESAFYGNATYDSMSYVNTGANDNTPYDTTGDTYNYDGNNYGYDDNTGAYESTTNDTGQDTANATTYDNTAYDSNAYSSGYTTQRCTPLLLQLPRTMYPHV